MTSLKLTNGVNEYQNEGTYINEIDDVNKILHITINFGGDWNGITNYDSEENWNENVKPEIEANIFEELQEPYNDFSGYAGYKIIIDSIVK